MDAYAVPPPYPTQSAPGTPPPTEPPKQLGGLATALTVLFAIMIAIMAFDAVALLGRASHVAGGGTYEIDVIHPTDTFVTLTGAAWFLMFIAIAVVFIIWQFRHAKNAKLLGSTRKLGPGMSIGGWFIPLANFILPAMQLFGASRFSKKPRRDWHDGGSGAAIVVWWAIAFNLGNVLSGVEASMYPAGWVVDAQYRSDLAASDRMGAVADFLLIVAAALAIVMVRSLSALQEQALANANPGMVSADPAWGVAVQPGSGYGPPPSGAFTSDQGWTVPGGGVPPTGGAQPPAGLQPPAAQGQSESGDTDAPPAPR